MKKLFLFIILLGQMWAQSGPYQQFLDFMNTPGGRILEIEFYQEQNGERYESNGTFYYMGKHHYTFDAHDQRMTYNRGDLTTINKLGKQVILDSAIPGDVTIFDILTGENDAVEIGEPLLEKSGFRIPFTLSEWDINGKIMTNHGSGQPREIIMRLSNSDSLSIKIISAEPLGNRAVGEIDLSEYETIDLRE